MKKSSRLMIAFAILALAVSFASNNLAQNREKFAISAKPGGVNSVMGHVMVTRAGQSAQLLTSQDNLVAGDVVTSGRDSQAEILLNPGSYLRLGADTTFTLADNSLEHLVLKLNSGSAIIEATGPDDAKFQINIETVHERMAIVRSGIYRVNVSADSTELLVRKGRVLLADGQLIKGGKKVTFSGNPLIAKVDKHDVDSFDQWSKQRAETLAQANRKLSNRIFNGYLSNNTLWDYWFAPQNAWGLWTYSPFSRCYTFLPFYYGWSSPYGNYYGNYFNYYNYYYFPRRGSYGNGPVISNNPPSGGSSGGPLVRPTNPGPGPGPGTAGSPAPTIQQSPRMRPRDPDAGGRVVRPIKDPD